MLLDLFFSAYTSLEVLVRDRDLLPLVLQLQSLDEKIDEELVVKDQVWQVNLLRQVITLVALKELGFHLHG